MIYSISQGFIFARGIKTASTSLADELAKKSRPLEKSIIYKIIRRIPKTEKIYPFYDFRNHPHTSLSKSKSIIPSHLFNSCIKFGVVREPVSWMMSGYKHWLRIHRNSEEYSQVTINSFEDFIRFRMDQYPPLQALQFLDRSGELLSDFVGNFHNLDEFSVYLEGRLGFSINIAHLNTAPSTQKIEVSQKERTLVEQACYLDYSIFDFEQLDGPVVYQKEATDREKLKHAWFKAGGDDFDPWKFKI